MKTMSPGKTEKFLKQKGLEMKAAMEKCLRGEHPECIVEGCLAKQFRSGVDYCSFHWGEELARRELELAENHKKRAKQNPRKIEEGQAMEFYFQQNRKCEKCGMDGLIRGQGIAVYREGFPRKNLPARQGLMTLCNECLEKL